MSKVESKSCIFKVKSQKVKLYHKAFQLRLELINSPFFAKWTATARHSPAGKRTLKLWLPLPAD